MIGLKLIIRKMTQEDIVKIQDIARKSWHATYEGIIPPHIQENFLNVAYSDQMMERRLNHSLIYVAEVNQQAVGFANYSPINENDEVELAAIYIYPDFQGAGVGTALLQKGINEIDRIKAILIDVEKENKIGTTFYNAKGFKVIEEFDDDFDGHLLKTVRMKLEI